MEAAVKEARAGVGIVKVEKRESGRESQGQEGWGLDLMSCSGKGEEED